MFKLKQLMFWGFNAWIDWCLIIKRMVADKAIALHTHTTTQFVHEFATKYIYQSM